MSRVQVRFDKGNFINILSSTAVSYAVPNILRSVTPTATVDTDLQKTFKCTLLCQIKCIYYH